MGEAKRKREHALAAPPRTTIDLETGRVSEARDAGDPERFMASVAEMVVATAAGIPVKDRNVPCNGCRECCYHAGVDVYPERGDDISRLSVRQDADGRYFLNKRDDGACVHLGESGCTVYEHRPAACRHYDCRLYALTNVLDRYDGDHQQPVWRFKPTTPRGQAIMMAMGAKGLALYARAQRDGTPMSGREVAIKVIADPRLGDAIEACETLVRASPEEQTKALGFDPRAVTDQHVTEAWRKLMEK